MSEFNSSKLENYGTIEYWKSQPPEELLEAFLHELKSPLTSIKGWVEILRQEGLKENHSHALDAISNIVKKIEADEDLIEEYLAGFKGKT